MCSIISKNINIAVNEHEILSNFTLIYKLK
jgi:hypothetical protein